VLITIASKTPQEPVRKRVVKDQLREQREEWEYGNRKVVEFVETRPRENPL
jgi:hypothetical protein